MDTHPSPPPAPSRWRSLVHLYLPFVATLVLLLSPLPRQFFLGSPVLTTAILTHVIASIIYPPNRPPPTPEQTIPFTRKRLIYRAAVMFTFHRIFTPPRSSFVVDFLLDIFVIQTYMLPDIDVGQPQRRSEFFAAAKWMVVTSILTRIVAIMVPQSPGGWLYYLIFSADWVMFKKTYMGLVDDIINVLAYPNMNTWRGRLLVPLLQFVVIYVSLAQLLMAFVLVVDDSGKVIHENPGWLSVNGTNGTKIAIGTNSTFTSVTA